MTTITLNRVALKALIDADPEFELSLKNAVLSEVGRRFFEKDAKRVIAAAQPELFKKALDAFQANSDINTMVQIALESYLTVRDNNWYSRPKISDETKKLIAEAVTTAKNNAIAAAILPVHDEIKNRVQEKIDATNIDERIEKRVDRLIEEEIERRAEERFKVKMARVREAMT